MKKIVSIVGVMVALVLSLTGCMKMDFDVTVSSPEKASITSTVGIDKNLLGGMSLEDLIAKQGGSTEALFANLPEGVTKARFETADYVGFKLTATDQTLQNLSDLSGQIATKFNLEYKDGSYFFSASGFGGGDTSTLNESQLTISFPGPVTEASSTGVISGNTVTFDLKNTTGEVTATGTDADNTALILSGAFGLLSLIGAVVGVAIMRRPETTEAH